MDHEGSLKLRKPNQGKKSGPNTNPPGEAGGKNGKQKTKKKPCPGPSGDGGATNLGR